MPVGLRGGRRPRSRRCRCGPGMHDPTVVSRPATAHPQHLIGRNSRTVGAARIARPRNVPRAGRWRFSGRAAWAVTNAPTTPATDVVGSGRGGDRKRTRPTGGGRPGPLRRKSRHERGPEGRYIQGADARSAVPVAYPTCAARRHRQPRRRSSGRADHRCGSSRTAVTGRLRVTRLQTCQSKPSGTSQNRDRGERFVVPGDCALDPRRCPRLDRRM